MFIGDGAGWVRGMRDELMPKDRLVLDLHRLKENTMEVTGTSSAGT